MAQRSSSKKSGVPVVLWIFGGCGCLGIGGFCALVLLAAVAPFLLAGLREGLNDSAKEKLNTLNHAQQAFQRQNGAFATSTDDLDPTIKSTLFEFEVVPQENASKSTVTTAIPFDPEKRLKAYTGFTFIVGSDPKTAKFTSGICETTFTSQLPPDPPSIPNSVDEPVVCPPGSILVVEKVAKK